MAARDQLLESFLSFVIRSMYETASAAGEIAIFFVLGFPNQPLDLMRAGFVLFTFVFSTRL